MSTFIDVYNMAKSLTPALDAEQFAFSLNGGVTLRGYRGEVSEGVPLVLLHSRNKMPPTWPQQLPSFLNSS